MPHRVAGLIPSAITNIKTSILNPNQTLATDAEGRGRRPPLERNPPSAETAQDPTEEIPYHKMYSSDPFLQFQPRRQSTPKEKEEKKKAKKEQQAAQQQRKKEEKEAREKKERESGNKSPRLISLPGFGAKNKDATSNARAGLDWTMESPPIVFHGDVESSSGALVSGQVFLEVKDDWYEVERLVAALNLRVSHRKAFQKDCGNCSDQYTELKKWTLIGAPTTLRRGRHAYPFSVLLEGHLPASMETPLVNVVYEFKAEATPVPAAPANPNNNNNKGTPASAPTARINHTRGGLSVSSAKEGKEGKDGKEKDNPTLKLLRRLEVRRSLPPSGSPHNSVRVFPPTNIKASAEYSQIIHPNNPAGHKVSLRLDGLSGLHRESNTIEYWKLKKVTWKLEETIKTVPPACKKHLPPVEGAGTNNAPQITTTDNGNRGFQRTETRILGEKHMYDGWKADYTATDGYVDFEFDYHVTSAAAAAAASQQQQQNGPLGITTTNNSSSSNGANANANANNTTSNPALLSPSPNTPTASAHYYNSGRYACDTRCPDGTEVSHALLIEMVVSKEWAPVGKPHLASQTGTGRILRMQYHVLLTDSPGAGVSWDNEAPPVYQDVPPRPPGYPGSVAPPPEFSAEGHEGYGTFEVGEPIEAAMRQGRGRSPEPALTFRWDRAARECDDIL